jgi:hypothetical protein
MSRKSILQKLGLPHHEYWPSWTVLGPILPIWIYYGFKARNLTYFTTVNLKFKDGDFHDTSKMSILNLIPNKYKPKTIFIPRDSTLEYIHFNLKNSIIDFPFIAKPDIGGKGRMVSVINTNQDLQIYLSTINEDFLIQEKIDYPIELGVFYYHIPNTDEYKITGIVQKEFLWVEGDGNSTLEKLMLQNKRSATQVSRFKKLKDNKLNYIPKLKERIELEPIGNHCRGTKFIDTKNLIDENLVKIFHNISKQIDGFYYGRYDLKVKSLEALNRGDGIRIMELNGLNSTPAHIYDSNTKLWEAYKILAAHVKIVYRIARIHLKNGVKATPVMDFIRIIKL